MTKRADSVETKIAWLAKIIEALKNAYPNAHCGKRQPVVLYH